jgi:FMN-dependent oxidoreductase (nitrilotriacetate monooxygenase family)
MTDPKRIHLNLFEMSCVSHITHGMWRHADNNRHRFNELGFWLDLARLLEYGTFDAMFLADVIGTYDTFRGGHETSVEEGMQIPNNDPIMHVPAMAAVTDHLGFAVTCSTTYEPPFAFARRMSTVDHLSAGRIGWNVVTSYLPNAARNFGHDDEIEHDSRYERADEYMDVVYKLWEGSWEDGAVLADRRHGIYADPAKVHYINHEGPYYTVAGPHLCEPSPQRTPVIFQAGVSDAGRQFAGKHAEAIFLGGESIRQTRFFVDDIRRIAREHGREPGDIKFFPGVNIIVGRNGDEVAQKVSDYERLRSVEGYLAHWGSPIDLTEYPPDQRIDSIDGGVEDTRKALERFRRFETVGEALDSIGAFNRPFSVAGTPDVVVDHLEEWVDATGIDGFNIIQQLTPGTALDVIELVVPELRRRGRFRHSYADEGGSGTLRERLFGAGGRTLKSTHPGARFRMAPSDVGSIAARRTATV